MPSLWEETNLRWFFLSLSLSARRHFRVLLPFCSWDLSSASYPYPFIQSAYNSEALTLSGLHMRYKHIFISLETAVTRHPCTPPIRRSRAHDTICTTVQKIIADSISSVERRWRAYIISLMIRTLPLELGEIINIDSVAGSFSI